MATPRAEAASAAAVNAGSARSRFDCSHCGAVFVRKEHRDRHVLAHLGVKAHRCHICLKAFSRADTLSRHISNHDGGANVAYSPRRCVQACVPCAQRKQRCDGARPCRRCVTSRQACHYQDQTTLPLDHAQQDVMASWNHNDTDEHDNVDMSNLDWPTTLATNLRTGVDWGLMDFPFIFDSSPLTPGAEFTAAAHVTNVMLDNHQQSSVQHSQPHLVDNVLTPGTGRGTEEPHAPTAPPQSSLLEFPYCGPNTLEEAESEVFGHILGVPDGAYISLQQFHAAQLSSPSFSSAAAAPSSYLPPKRLFEVFVDLYFEYFDHQFPCIHPARFEDTGMEHTGEYGAADETSRRPLSWKLLLIVAFIGSQYSAIENIGRYQVAMRALVRRAMEGDMVLDLSELELSDVQAIFLHHVYLMSSGSRRDKTLFQYERGMLVTMCRHLSAGPKSRSALDTPLRNSSRSLEERWLTWLHEEEQVRLICCVHIVESLGLIFLDLPVLFSLTELVQRVPRPWKIWQCRDAYTWESETIALSSPPTTKQQDQFLTKLSLLQLYVDERCLQKHVETSQLVRAHFSSYLGISPGAGATAQNRHQDNNNNTTTTTTRNDTRSNSEEQGPPATSLPDTFKGHNPHLDTLMDTLLVCDDAKSQNPSAASTSALASTAIGHSQQETLAHILAMLRHVPLHALHAATGYQADAEQMSRAKTRLRNLLFRRGEAGTAGGETAAARRCMWHAARVFAILRARTRFTCYDMFCLCVAVSYILCFCEGLAASVAAAAAADREDDPSQRHQQQQQQEQQHQQRQPGRQKRVIIRLDQLSDRESVTAYINGSSPTGDGEHVLLHLTGVGILNRPDLPRRLLGDVCSTYESQIAWRGMCYNFARAYKQILSGQHPTPQADDM